jgi:hypothetical protein
MPWIFSSPICPADRQVEQVAEKERWLIISYFSNVDGMACAQHIDDRRPYFRKKGITPLLLTSVCGNPKREFVIARVISLAPSGIRFEMRHFFRRKWGARRGFHHKMLEGILLLPLLPFYLIEKMIVDLDSQWSWFPLAALRGRRLCREYGPEVIYSTGGGASAHVAAALVSRWCGTPWIAELQDPLVYEGLQRSNRARWLYARIEKIICRRAARVVFLTEAAMRNAAKRTDLGDRGAFLYPGADPFRMTKVDYQRGSCLRFAHFGSIGGSRNPRVLLDSLDRIFRERPILADTIRLELYGTWDRDSAAMVRKFSWKGVVEYHGRKSREESLAAMQKADVLLLIQNIDGFSSETIPSKIYEYLFAGRPILGLVYGNREIERLLEDEGHLVVEANRVEEVKESMEILIGRWERGNLDSHAAPRYTVEDAVGKLIDLGLAVSEGREEPSQGQDAGE